MATKTNKDLLSHYKAILRLGVPIAIGQLGVIVVGFVDTMMVGQYSTDSLAAASFVNNVFNLVTFLLMGYAYGLTPLVSALYGRGEQREAGAVLRNALASNGLFGLMVLLVMGILYFFIDSMGQPHNLLPLIRPYYLIVLASVPFIMLFNVLRQFTDGTTDTMAGMYPLLLGNVLNIVGNWLLIYGVGPFPELGLIGAGISTLLARVFMVVLLVATICCRRQYAVCRKGFAQAKVQRSMMLVIHRNSYPLAAQMGMENGAFTMSAVMAGWLGAVELASYQVLVTIGTLGFLFYYSFGAGMSIRVAAFVGQNDWQRVRLASIAGRNILIVLAAISSLVIFAFSKQLIGFFTSDDSVITLSLSLIAPLLLYQLADAMQIGYANALRGTSQVSSMMWVAFVSYLVVNIPLAYTLGFLCEWGIHGIFLAFSAGLLTAAALFCRNFYRVVRGNVNKVV